MFAELRNIRSKRERTKADSGQDEWCPEIM